MGSHTGNSSSGDYFTVAVLFIIIIFIKLYRREITSFPSYTRMFNEYVSSVYSNRTQFMVREKVDQ